MLSLTLKSSKEAVTSPDKMFEHLKTLITDEFKEHFLVVSLNTRNRVTAIDVVSIGTLTCSLVHPRECYSVAIKRRAAHIIIAHNHPSGDTDPSEDDLKITKRLVDAGKIMGIEVLDHIIFTQSSFLSFKEKCLI